MSIIDIVNSCPPSFDLFARAVKRIQDLPPEDRGSFEVRTFSLLQMLDESKDLDNHLDKADLLMSIEFRLQALNRLCETTEFKVWSRKCVDPKVVLIHPALLASAALEPLTGSRQEARFDTTTFFRRVLEVAEPDGFV